MTPNNETKIHHFQVELIYALPHRQKLIQLTLHRKTTVLQAIQQSEILQQYPEIDLAINQVGIFSKVCQLSDEVQQGDRIEIYRPLIIDPKEARKKRALKK